MHFESMINIEYFNVNLFVLQKRPFPSWKKVGFFPKYLYSSSPSANPCSFTKNAWKIATKRFKHKTFSQSYQRYRTSSAKRRWPTPIFRLQLRASLMTGSFLLKLKTITTCFEQDIFHTERKSILRYIAGCYQNKSTSQTFSWG